MNLLRTLAAISSMTMLSRITGLLRETLTARAFGASAYSDAFIIAFRLPNLLRRLFAEGAFSQAFVPILAQYKTQYGEERTKSLVDHVATVLLWSTLLVAIVGILTAPWLIYWFAPSLRDVPDPRQAAVVMTRLMFPYICAMSFVALAGGILNTWRQFKIPAFSPVLLNISFIVAALFVVPYLEQPIYAMSLAVIVGGLLQVGIQIPALVKIGMLPSLSWNPMVGLRDEGVRQMLRKMGPALFAVSATQISLLINMTIASSLGEGKISALSYADRLMEFPIALLGVALGTVLLPSLSKAASAGDKEDISSLLNWGLRLTFMLALPAALGMAILARPMIATLFHYGAFDDQALATATGPLVAYSVGLLGIVLIKTLSPAFFAQQDTRTPVRIALVAVVVTQVLNFVFYFFVPQLGVAGLALSLGAGACVNAALLYVILRRRDAFTLQPGWGMFFLKLLVALAVMGALAWYGEAQLDWAAMRAHYVQRALALFLIIGVCAAGYFAVLLALGFRLRDFKRIAN
jgi:putative peptidoglycan lipid II flippase